jgi:diacylglycerol kinase family enzyme
MSGQKKHIFIFNPKSFSTIRLLEQVIEDINSYFYQHEDADYSIFFSKYPRNTIGLIRRIFSDLDKNVTARVYAIGGDGILFDCLNGIIGFPNAELASISYGVCNDFVLSFGKNSVQLFKNIEAQITAPVIDIDVMHCGNSYAINSCCFGVAAWARWYVKRYEHYIPVLYRRFLPRFYFATNVRGFFDRGLSNQRYEVILDGLHSENNLCSIVIANGSHIAGKKVPMPSVSPNDCELDILTAKSASKIALISALNAYYNGSALNPLLSHRKVKNIIISSNEPLAIAMDGEFFFESKLSISIIPHAVKFAVVKSMVKNRITK